MRFVPVKLDAVDCIIFKADAKRKTLPNPEREFSPVLTETPLACTQAAGVFVCVSSVT